jgi:hypothetical protein
MQDWKQDSSASWMSITWVLIENSRDLLRAAEEINGIQ